MRLLCDVDGVLADFLPRFCEYAHDKFDTVVVPSQVTDWDLTSTGLTQAQVTEIFSDDEFFKDLPMIPGAKHNLCMLNELYQIVFVTACPDSWKGAPAKVQWLKQHFSFANDNNIIVTRAKHLIPGEVFIEDNPRNLKRWLDENTGFTALVNAPYNRGQRKGFDIATGNWDIIRAMLTTYYHDCRDVMSIMQPIDRALLEG